MGQMTGAVGSSFCFLVPIRTQLCWNFKHLTLLSRVKELKADPSACNWIWSNSARDQPVFCRTHSLILEQVAALCSVSISLFVTVTFCTVNVAMVNGKTGGVKEGF
eukprot:1522340-Ditylum_brightwellii.AAC.1